MTDERSTNGYWRLTAAQRRYLPVKRALDVALTAVLLLLLALPMLLITAAVKCSGPDEPVIFRQERMGWGGESFTIYKFRSMRHGLAVTPIGKLLRSASLDELPQLWQVLTGKMSLVGPRPLALYEQSVHALRRASGVYQLRPGITGLAQISGRDLVSDETKAALDRQYLEELSLALDTRILFSTVGKVLRREGVEQK